MTVSSITNKQSYNGNGSQSVFAYTFKIFADTDVKVYVGTSLKTLSTHYTLSGVGSAGGGNVTFTAGNIPAVGTGNVTILRSLALTQGVDLVNYGRFDAEVIEAQYDKLTMMVQQLQEQADRTIRFSTTVSDAGGVEITDTVAERSGKVLAYDANGDLSVANELGDWQGNWSTTTVYAVRDLVLDSVTNNVYTCLISHIAGTLSTDVAASKWALVINAAAVAASASAAAADLVLTNADVVLTNADVVLTNADVVLTHADVVLAEADKVQTALDRIATGADVTTATTKASEASTSASNAASSLATFTGQYVSQATAPSSPSEGDLWFDTTANTMKVYDGSGFINAVSSVNGIENSVQHTATAGQTSFTATYDAGFLQVYLNGLRLDAEDYTATNGSTVVLGTGATLNDVVFIHSFGTFVLANHYTKSEDDALLAAKATVANFTSTGIDDNATSTKVTVSNTGVDVTGRATTDGITSSGSIIFDNGGSSVGIHSDSSDGSYIAYGANEYLRFLYDAGGGETMRMHDSGYVTMPQGVTLGNGNTYAAANTLDDYEEGTWTPNFAASSGGSLTTTSNSAYYTKVGNLVTAWFDQLAWSSHNLTGTYLNITGLPFPLAGSRSVGSPGVSSSNSFSSLDRLIVQGDSGSSTLWMISMGATNNNYAHMAAASVAATGTWYGMSITYRTA